MPLQVIEGVVKASMLRCRHTLCQHTISSLTSSLYLELDAIVVSKLEHDFICRSWLSGKVGALLGWNSLQYKLLTKL